MKKAFIFILLAVVLLLPMTVLADTAIVKYIDENATEKSHECTSAKRKPTIKKPNSRCASIIIEHAGCLAI